MKQRRCTIVKIRLVKSFHTDVMFHLSRTWSWNIGTRNIGLIGWTLGLCKYTIRWQPQWQRSFTRFVELKINLLQDSHGNMAFEFKDEFFSSGGEWCRSIHINWWRSRNLNFGRLWLGLWPHTLVSGPKDQFGLKQCPNIQFESRFCGPNQAQSKI